jgi:SPP1 family predicted phage head-tail adaptor
MSAGRLNQRVAFESPDDASNGAGGTLEGWAAEFTVWAGYRRLRGGETVQAARLAGSQPTVITVRTSSQARRITTDWRARDDRTGEIFNIRAIIETDDRAMLEITAESGVAT